MIRSYNPRSHLPPTILRKILILTTLVLMLHAGTTKLCLKIMVARFQFPKHWYLMKPDSLVNWFIQMDSDDNKFETCKTITKEFLSAWAIGAVPADEPLMTKSDDDGER